MNWMIAQGLLLPFLGTSLGSALVLFMKNEMKEEVQKSLTGFAAGVMVAASVWSLLIPAMNQAQENMGRLAFVPAVVGFCLGMLFLLILDQVTPHMHLDESVEGPKCSMKKTTMLVLAVVLHNIPEGMAVGVVYAGWLTGNVSISASAALALALGIAIQNFPEGAAISLPMRREGMTKAKAAFKGCATGLVEPPAVLLAVLLSTVFSSVMPLLLSFAAGAMLYVTAEELIPESNGGGKYGTAGLIFGFIMMFALDVILG